MVRSWGTGLNNCLVSFGLPGSYIGEEKYSVQANLYPPWAVAIFQRKERVPHAIWGSLSINTRMEGYLWMLKDTAFRDLRTILSVMKLVLSLIVVWVRHFFLEGLVDNVRMNLAPLYLYLQLPIQLK